MLLRHAVTALAAVSALALSAPAFAQSDDAPVQPSGAAPNLTPPPPSPEALAPPDGSQLPDEQMQPEDQAPPDEYGDEGDEGYAQPTPPPPAAEVQDQAPSVQVTVSTPPPVDGQWVFTGQYGWVWMPYAQSYTYVVPGGDPFMFVYSVGFGWRWVTAPWVYGWGPRPYWGYYGPRHFYWHRHRWFRVPRYHRISPMRLSYHPVYRRSGYHGSYYRGPTRGPGVHRSPPPGYVVRGGARGPVFHGAPPHSGPRGPVYRGGGRPSQGGHGWGAHPSPPGGFHSSGGGHDHGGHGGGHGGHGRR